MTPADIQNKKFDKGMGGYKTEDVHQFMAQVADYVEDLEQENLDLQKKLEVLAEKLEQYREDEDSLRAALIGAQKLGQSVVRESQRKAESIMAQAVRKAESLVGDAQKNIDKEALALKMMQKDVKSFKELVIRMYTEQLAKIKASPDETFVPKMEIAHIKYTPPVLETVDTVEDVEDESVSTIELEEDMGIADDDGDTKTFVMVGQDATAKEDGRENKRARFGQLSQFFGEDKPIERQ